MKTDERIKEVITDLILRDSYWGYLFSKINRKVDEFLPAPMGICPEIDGLITLLYNPKFIDLADDEFLKIVVEHEGIHILNNHIPRFFRIIDNEINNCNKKQKSEKWNIATDCAVNTLINIKKSYMLGNFEFNICHPDIYKLPSRMNAEYYFDNIPDEKSQTFSSSDGEKGCNFEKRNIDDHGTWGKNIKKISDISSMASRIEQYTESIVEESYNNVRKKGNLSSHITQLINELLKPPQIPYYRLITKLVKGSRLSKFKKSYSRINKKRVYTFFIDKKNLPVISPFPGKTKDFSFNISILLDTSGSMSIEDILEGLSGIKHIIESDKDCRTTVIENDTNIRKEYEIKKLNDIQFNIKGRGGTRLAPALFRCKDLNSDVTLVFTDGFIDDINSINRKLLPKKIIWIITKNGISKYLDRTGYIVRLSK